MNMHTTDVSTLDRDGYVVLNGVLPPPQVEQAHQDLAKLFDQDVDSRKQRGLTEAYFADGPVGPTILTAPSHLALDMFGKSAAFDQLLEQMLTHPRVQRVVEAWCGPHFRIGSVNIRYMTGAIDPRWDTPFEKPFRLSKNPARTGLNLSLTWNIFNRIFKAKSFRNVTGAFGKQGDVYFFPNGEIWHGRLPNMNGRRTMICLMGCSAVTPESAVRPVAASKEVLAKLPPRLAQGLGGPFQVNDASNTLIDRLYKTRQPAGFFSLEYWSKLERRIAEFISGWLVRWGDAARKTVRLVRDRAGG